MLKDIIETIDISSTYKSMWKLAGGSLVIERGRDKLPAAFTKNGIVKPKKGSGFNIDDRYVIFAKANISFPFGAPENITAIANLSPLKDGLIDHNSTGMFVQYNVDETWWHVNSKKVSRRDDRAVKMMNELNDFIEIVNKRLKDKCF